MTFSGWPDELARARLHVVTGKGGTGMTTVAAALALALATDGRRTLLMEVEGCQAWRSCSTPRRCPMRSDTSRWCRTAAR